MKLEAGMYVRTKEGNIEKICAIENEHIYTDEDYLSWYPSSNAISKASHNIIDLIEVGDYVNGHLVTKISKDGVIWLEGYSIDGTWRYVDFINEWGDNIKSIVTKECFESMQYEVK